MADLFDELRGKQNKEEEERVVAAGGDLISQLQVKQQPTPTPQRPPVPRISQEEINRQTAAERQRIAAEQGPLESLAIAGGKGLADVLRGFGVLDDTTSGERAAFEALEQERPVTTGFGEVLGQAAPFLPLGVAAGAIRGLGGRVAAGTGLGAAEGAVISEGQGGDAIQNIRAGTVGGGVGGAAEILFPVLGRLGNTLLQRMGRQPRGALITPEGTPTPELQSALDDAGVSFEDLTREAFTQIQQARPGTDPQQLARQARFQSQGIPATAGDISQDFAQQAQEERLVSMAASEAGEPLRQMRLDQSEAFKSKVDELVNTLGVPAETGDSIKSALSGRKKLLKSEKNALYKQVAETAPEVRAIPLTTDSLRDVIVDKDTLDDLSITAPEAVNAFKTAMARFGIDQSEQSLALLERRGLEAQPLSVGNFERLRKTLNAIDRADDTGASKVMTGPVLRALDEEADLVADALQKTGVTDENITELLGQARERVRTLKTEFSPQAITGRLIDTKKDGVSPMIEASKVSTQLLGNNQPIENLQRTIKSLAQSGDKGRKAIGDLQASVVMRALDDALKSPTRKTSGLQTIGANQFVQSLNKFGDDKLEVLFRGNPKALKQLQGLKETAGDITPTAGATPRGSAPVILDVLSRVGSMPGLAFARDLAKMALRAGADDRAVRRAMQARPEFKRDIQALTNEFPALASSLGVAALVNREEDNQ